MFHTTWNIVVNRKIDATKTLQVKKPKEVGGSEAAAR
jgi:hypothetical protein